MTETRTKQAKPRRRQARGDAPITIRLPRKTLRLIEQWSSLYGCTRSDIVRAWITYALHAVNTDAAEILAT
jgi:hypothetical protein